MLFKLFLTLSLKKVSLKYFKVSLIFLNFYSLFMESAGEIHSQIASVFLVHTQIPWCPNLSINSTDFMNHKKESAEYLVGLSKSKSGTFGVQLVRIAILECAEIIFCKQSFPYLAVWGSWQIMHLRTWQTWNRKFYKLSCLIIF